MKIKGRFSIILLVSLSLTFDHSIVAISRMRVTYGPDNGVAHQGVCGSVEHQGAKSESLGGTQNDFSFVSHSRQDE